MLLIVLEKPNAICGILAASQMFSAIFTKKARISQKLVTENLPALVKWVRIKCSNITLEQKKRTTVSCSWQSERSSL